MTAEQAAGRRAEIRRRGAIFDNHIGRGDAPRLPEWGGIPVFGCSHPDDPRLPD